MPLRRLTCSRRIGTQALARYPRAEWERHTVGKVMRPDAAAIAIGPDPDAIQALAPAPGDEVGRRPFPRGGRQRDVHELLSRSR